MSRIPRSTCTPAGELVAQDPFGGVLRDRDETERHVGGQFQLKLCGLVAVDVDDLAAHLDRRVQNPAQHAHALEYFERTRLHANGFRVVRRIGYRVDDATADAAAGQFDGRGQADGPRAGDEHWDFWGVSHHVIMLPP